MQRTVPRGTPPYPDLPGACRHKPPAVDKVGSPSHHHGGRVHAAEQSSCSIGTPQPRAPTCTLNQQRRKRSIEDICHSEKNHLRGLRDPLGHQGLWILSGEEEKERTLSCQGKEEGSKGQWAKDACSVDVSSPFSKLIQSYGWQWCPSTFFLAFGCSFSPYCTDLCNCKECAFLQAVQLNGEE